MTWFRVSKIQVCDEHHHVLSARDTNRVIVEVLVRYEYSQPQVTSNPNFTSFARLVASVHSYLALLLYVY